MQLSGSGHWRPFTQEAHMIFKITLAIVVGLFALISIPSIVATCMLLAKSIDSYSEKRQRRALYNR